MTALFGHVVKMVFATICLGLMCGSAFAQSNPDIQTLADRYFGAETRAERSAALVEIEAVAEGDNAARFVLGSARFFTAIETLAQGLYRHGFEPAGGAATMMFRTPVPPNPQPEPLDYAGFRDLLDDLHGNLDLARSTLSGVDPDEPFKIVLDMAETRLDLTGADDLPVEANLQDVARAVRFLRSADADARLTFAYDNADAIWLEGYANVLMAQIDFVLAHDFQRAFDTTMHAFFPRAGLPLADIMVSSERRSTSLWDDWRIFDLVALVHLIDFEVTEPQRRASAREHLLEMVRLSRANWVAIGAETDADREWLPGPHQSGGHPIEAVEVTENTVAAWHDMLDLLEQVLNGEVLVPHMRFSDQGLNLRTYFESGERFDLILFLTGSGALPYLEDGPVIEGSEWRRVTRALGQRGFLGTAVWFN